ncbi:MAG: hypothetical protein R3194_02540 [Limnobacter sp.]|nr:hypothetical protein [Limnobacter sp.]
MIGNNSVGGLPMTRQTQQAQVNRGTNLVQATGNALCCAVNSICAATCGATVFGVSAAVGGALTGLMIKGGQMLASRVLGDMVEPLSTTSAAIGGATLAGLGGAVHGFMYGLCAPAVALADELDNVEMNAVRRS